MSDIKEKKQKFGYVAIVGLPNAGKSTLMNVYLEQKVSIVSPKPQTTRANVTTILSGEDFQIVFIDTPGLLKPKYKMQEVMASLVGTAVNAADVILFVVDCSAFSERLNPGEIKISKQLASRKVIIALNKIDLKKKHELLEIIQKYSEAFPGAEIFPISALKRDGTNELFGAILESIPEGVKLYPDDIISTEPEKFFVAEIIREAVFMSLNDELPYSSAVIIENYEEKSPKVVIYASILVEKDSQKPIVIGRKGDKIKEIGTKARLAIEEFLETEVYLDLNVKVRKDWRNKDIFLREIGLFKKNYI